jgi:3-oxoacyl-[acyl-carrier-protein] synthase-3
MRVGSGNARSPRRRHQPRFRLEPMTALLDVFITGAGAFLPGPPVSCADIEEHIGRVNGRPSALGRRALKWNGVETRHYALDAAGAVLHTNADMCARAVNAALDDAGLQPRDLTYLAAATTQGDYLVPGHATAVHAALGAGRLEIASFQSVCGSSLMAAKAAWLEVRAGEHDRVCACAGEFSSRWFRPHFYEGSTLVDAKGRLAAEADYLRFTLSDGAGAIVMEPTPRPDGLSLRVEFIDIVSLAGEFDPCMWAGAPRADRADLATAWCHAGPIAAQAGGALALLQDFELLKRVIRAWVGVYLEKVDCGRIDPACVDWLLCHYSARSLREEIVTLLDRTAGMIPAERWFSNLATVGNIGAASIWVMLDAFLRTGRLERGQKILCVVPESGRALVGFMMLEAV